jgi:aldehyde dehydrogenase (NAD+)
MDWEYSPAPESSSIADIRDRYLPFIDGAFREGSGEDRDTINPGTGEGFRQSPQ